MIPIDDVTMEPSSKGSGSTGEMLPKMAATSSTRAAPTVQHEKAAEGAAWIQVIRNKKAATASSGGVPTVHPGKGSAATVSSGEMLDKKAATVHPGKGPAATVTSGKMLNKKAATVVGTPMVHPGKLAAGSPGDMLQKKADVGSSGGAKGATGSGSSGTMLQKKAALGSSEGAPVTFRGKVTTGSGSSGTVLQKKVAAASSRGRPTALLGNRVVGTGLNDGMPKNKARAFGGDSPAFGALEGNTAAQDCEESVARHSTKEAHTFPSTETPQEHCTEDKADMALGGEMIHKQISKVEADTGLSGEMLDKHLTKQADTAMNKPESASKEIVHVSEDAKEAESLIKQLNTLGIGEPISEKLSLYYLGNLARRPPSIDLAAKTSNEELCKQDNRHALYRLRYYQYKLRQASQEEPSGNALKRILAISEHDCSAEFLKKEGFFWHFEKDKTFDWSFHLPYVYCSQLVDYQRLVLKNHGYSRYSKYHTYLNSYEIEQEYVNYCEELSKQLKWMEPYIGTRRSSLKWGEISSRACLQAIKIAATSFHKITACLAYNAYFELKESMSYDFTWFKEYDGVYFEIWRRINQGMSFEKALEEVYNLNWFPIRQPMMKAALTYVESREMMKEEFLTCMEDITPDVQEDKAKELIKEAVNCRIQKPKSYEQYIRKKIHIAQIIGILSKD